MGIKIFSQLSDRVHVAQGRLAKRGEHLLTVDYFIVRVPKGGDAEALLREAELKALQGRVTSTIYYYGDGDYALQRGENGGDDVYFAVIALYHTSASGE